MPVIRVENLSKAYRLGQIGGAYLHEELSRWWARVRKKPDPKLKIGQEHLAERFGERFWALKDVSFDVEQGEVLGIIGRNGAGKSSLLKILSQVTAPTEGVVKIKGRVASLLEVGTGFHPELTGRENIFLNGAILGMTKREIERKFDEIVAFSEVEQFIDTPVKRYSSGMYVRLAFAVAAHLEPEILIVDEVLAVGDAAFQKKCLGKMGDVAHEGRTVLFVSHNMAAVQQLCGRAMLLSEGRIAETGEARACIARYVAPPESEVATIVGAVSRIDPCLSLTAVLINGSESREVQVPSGCRELTVEVRGFLSRDVRLGLEFWLCDSNGLPLAFYGTGHSSGVSPLRRAGRVLLQEGIRLPERMHRGIYMVSLSLTDHGRTGWADLDHCARLHVAGEPTATGAVLGYDNGKGMFSLAPAYSYPDAREGH